jgi:hypothetical protein
MGTLTAIPRSDRGGQSIEAISPLTDRERAEAALQAAQTGTAAAKDAVEDLDRQLSAERNRRDGLAEKFDRTAVREDDDMARELQTQMAASDIRLRGLELRLESARQESKECQQTELRLGEDLSRVVEVEAIEIEAQEVQDMIAAARGAYDETNRAAQKFEAAMVALKSRAWRDDRHRHQASDAVFSLAARCKGFRY